MQLLDELSLQEDATALLDREITRTPDDTSLLYLRAMRAWEMGDLTGMERDLRKSTHRAQHADALNALGYTLTLTYPED